MLLVVFGERIIAPPDTLAMKRAYVLRNTRRQVWRVNA
jgi:hypothetical protein